VTHDTKPSHVNRCLGSVFYFLKSFSHPGKASHCQINEDSLSAGQSTSHNVCFDRFTSRLHFETSESSKSTLYPTIERPRRVIQLSPRHHNDSSSIPASIETIIMKIFFPVKQLCTFALILNLQGALAEDSARNDSTDVNPDMINLPNRRLLRRSNIFFGDAKG